MAQASEQGNDSASEAAKELEAELDSLERLVRGVSHDLNNLTTAIRTSVETLRGLPDEAPADARDPVLARIDGAAAQASRLMSALAAFGRQEVQIGATELGTLVTDAAQFLRRALRIEIDVEMETDRGSDRPEGQRLVRGDLSRVVRALIQLATRAARGDGRVALAATGEREITLTLTPSDPAAASVAPLARDVERAKILLDEIEGSIPLCYADGHGGWTASLRLSSAPPASIVAPKERGRGAALPRGRALIAEDHSQVRDALIDALSRCGFSVEAVGDGDTFVDRGIAEAGNHDVFLIDFDLPGRDGATALEAVRAAGVLTPALMISGNIDFGSRIEGIQNAEFLKKPFGLADIRAWATNQLSSGASETGATSR